MKYELTEFGVTYGDDVKKALKKLFGNNYDESLIIEKEKEKYKRLKILDKDLSIKILEWFKLNNRVGIVNSNFNAEKNYHSDICMDNITGSEFVMHFPMQIEIDNKLGYLTIEFMSGENDFYQEIMELVK